MTNKKYLIIPTTEIDKIDFSQVLETSAETLRTSVDGTKTFIKWKIKPDFINKLNSKEGPYNHQEILAIMASQEWSALMDENNL